MSFLISQPKHMLWVLKRTCSFKHPKHMFKLINKKIIAILRKNYLLNWPYALQAPFCFIFSVYDLFQVLIYLLKPKLMNPPLVNGIGL